MLLRSEDIKGFTIGAIDQQIGKVSDLLFDDLDWRIRYFAVDTGS